MKTRRRLWANNGGSGGGDDLRQLVTALGGNASVPALYDLRRGVTASANLVSQLDDARGPSGFAPSITATTTQRPTLDPAALTLTFNGTTNRLASASSAVFDVSGACAVFLVAAIPTTGALAYPFTITNGVRLFDLRAPGATAPAVEADDGAGHILSTASTVVPSTTRRLWIISKNASTGIAIDVPNKTRASATNTGSIGAGNNLLTIGAYNAGASNFSTLVFRALGVINRQVTAADIAILLAWATSAHQAVVA